MSALTGLLYSALVVYLGGWYIGKWSGNFPLLLFCLTLCTFAYWLAERLVFAPRRVQAVALLDQQAQARRNSLAQQGITKVDDANLAQAKQALMAQPWWLDWTAGIFPVILVVFLLRSFLLEPFKIPSGSMIPTLVVGDLILVNKFHYGLRLPVINKKILSNHDPKRGDVMVFRYPLDTNVDYIKRVVGLPGDEIRYSNQRLYLNGQPLSTTALPDFYDEDSRRYAKQFSEKLGEVDHRILVDVDRPSFIPANSSFPFAENCRYSAEGVTCKVPSGHYFLMGDNRDNSQDSRYWGFVPDENIVGRAFFVWMNFGNLGRIGAFH
jgi:signal peptidase I